MSSTSSGYRTSSDFLLHQRDNGITAVEPDAAAERDWVEHVSEVAGKPLYIKANSWFLGANIPGKPRVFMRCVGGCHAIRAFCNDVAADGYRGVVLRTADDSAHDVDEDAKAADVMIG